MKQLRQEIRPHPPLAATLAAGVCARGVSRRAAQTRSLDSLSGHRFNFIKPLKTVLLLGACALGTSLVGSAAPAEAALPDPPQPHWSHLPIWGVEAEARGYQIPLPFGIGFNYYREQQPFNIKDLQVSRGGDPVSVNEFLEFDKVDTTQQNGIVRVDAWLFPFLNIYGLAGYTSGKMEGQIALPDIPLLGIAAQNLPLNIGYEGPTYGGGVTLAGGFKVSDWRTLTLFVVADANYTFTDLDFTDERLFTDTRAEALVFSSRLGLRGKVAEKQHLAFWAGAMFQDVSEFLVGRAADDSFAFLVVQNPVAPWNAVIGGRWEMGRHFDLMVEGGWEPEHQSWAALPSGSKGLRLIKTSLRDCRVFRGARSNEQSV